MHYSQETDPATREDFGSSEDSISGSDGPGTKTKTDGASVATRPRTLVSRLQSQSPKRSPKRNKNKAPPTSSPSQAAHNNHLPRIFKRAARRLSETTSASSSSRATKAQEEERCKTELLEARRTKQAREKENRMTETNKRRAAKEAAERKEEEEEKREQSHSQAGPSHSQAGPSHRAEKRKRPSSNSRRGPKTKKNKTRRPRMIDPRFLHGVLSTCSLANMSQINKSKLVNVKEKDFRRLAAMKHLIDKLELRLYKMGVTTKMWKDWKRRQEARAERNRRS